MSYVSGFMMGAAIGKNLRHLLTGSRQPAKSFSRSSGMGQPVMQLVAALPGRRRYRTVHLTYDLAELLDRTLNQLDFVQSFRANAVSGSLILEFAPADGAKVDELVQWLTNHIF